MTYGGKPCHIPKFYPVSPLTDAPVKYAGETPAVDAAQQGIRLLPLLVLVNLGLVASGNFRRVLPVRRRICGDIHASVARALQLGALTQVVAAVLLWRRGRVPAWVARAGIGLFVMVFLQNGSATRSGTGCMCQLASASSGP